MTYGLAGGLSSAATAFGMLFVTHRLSPSEFGQLTLAITILTLVTSFGTLGASNGIQFYVLGQDLGSDKERSEALSSGVLLAALGLVGSALVVLGVWLLALSDGGLDVGVVTLVVLTSVTMAMSQVLQDLRRLRFQIWKFAATATLRAVVGAGIGVWLVYQGGGAFAYVEGLFIGSILALASGILFSLGDFRFWPTRVGLTRVLNYSWPLALSGGAAWIGSSANLWVLQWAGGSEQVGIYGLALRFGSIMGLVVVSVSQAWSPRVLSAWTEGPGVYSLVRRFAVLWSAVLVASLMCAVPAGLWIVYDLAGPQYSEAAGFMPVVMLTFAVQGLVTFTALGLTLTKRTRTIAVLTWMTSLLTLLLGLLLAPRFLSWGVACASLIGQVLLVILFDHYSRRAIRFPIAYLWVVVLWGVGLAACAVYVWLVVVYDAGSVVPAVGAAVAGLAIVGTIAAIYLKGDQPQHS